MKISINQDLFIVLLIVLIALIFFGIGRLSAPQGEPVLIKGLEKASIEDIKFPPDEQGGTEGDQEETDYKGKVVGSVNSDKYHLTDCPGAKQISEKNEIWFDSIEAAKKAGYKPAANCPGLIKE